MIRRIINRLLGRKAVSGLHDWRVQYEAVFEHMPVGVSYLTRDMRYIRINPYLEKRLGLRSEDVEGRFCYDVVGMYKDDPVRKGPDRVCDVCGVKTAIETGRPYKFTRKVSNSLIMDNMGVPVFSPEGKVIGAAEILMDVTARVGLEERLQEYATDLEKAVDAKTRELRRSKSFLDSIIQSTGDAILTLDGQGRVKFLNASAGGLLGRPFAELMDRPLAGLMDEQGAEKIKDALAEAGAMGTTVYNVRLTVAARDGARELLASFAPLSYQDGSSLFVCICKDVTKEATLEREKEEFVAMLTHDLKTPITSILGYSALGLNGDLGGVGGEVMASLMGIRTNADKMLGLVNNFLTAGRIEQMPAAPARAPVSLGEKLMECIGSMRPMFDEKEIDVFADIQEGLPHVSADREQIERVVYNLMSNAAKFTPRRGSVRARLFSEGDGQVVLEVRDTGPGVPEGDAPRLFDKYYRGSGANGSAGTGLGLYIAKSIVEAHDGGIELSTGEEGGTTFTVRLPVDN